MLSLDDVKVLSFRELRPPRERQLADAPVVVSRVKNGLSSGLRVSLAKSIATSISPGRNGCVRVVWAPDAGVLGVVGSALAVGAFPVIAVGKTGRMAVQFPLPEGIGEGDGERHPVYDVVSDVTQSEQRVYFRLPDAFRLAAPVTAPAGEAPEKAEALGYPVGWHDEDDAPDDSVDLRVVMVRKGQSAPDPAEVSEDSRKQEEASSALAEPEETEEAYIERLTADPEQPFVVHKIGSARARSTDLPWLRDLAAGRVVDVPSADMFRIRDAFCDYELKFNSSGGGYRMPEKSRARLAELLDGAAL